MPGYSLNPSLGKTCRVFLYLLYSNPVSRGSVGQIDRQTAVLGWELKWPQLSLGSWGDTQVTEQRKKEACRHDPNLCEAVGKSMNESPRATCLNSSKL